MYTDPSCSNSDDSSPTATQAIPDKAAAREFLTHLKGYASDDFFDHEGSAISREALAKARSLFGAVKKAVELWEAECPQQAVIAARGFVPRSKCRKKADLSSQLVGIAHAYHGFLGRGKEE